MNLATRVLDAARRRSAVARARGALAAPLFSLVATASASAQVAFSIDSTSQTIGATATGGTAITAGDLLQPAPSGVPYLGITLVPAQRMVSGAGGIGLAAGFDEVDAISFGQDHLMGKNVNGGDIETYTNGRVWFSVDRDSQGQPLSSWPGFPTVRQQYGSPGNASTDAEQAGDLFVPLTLPALPAVPGVGGYPHVGAVDGNSLPDDPAANSFAFPGLGLIEPAPIAPGTGGDNLDALDILSDLAAIPNTLYFSLSNASAAHYGPYVGGAILKHTTGTAGFSVYASPNVLGLDRAGAAGSDELDALALWDNGDGVLTVAPDVYDWLGAPYDMVLFSVKRNSAVIGQMDSLLGIPIEPGDVLIPPVLGGFTNYPGIFIPAEFLGLRTTRSHGVSAANACDLDALDVTGAPLFDCNSNAVEDALDIANGISVDVNKNGLPDTCDPFPTVYCTPKVNSIGCTPEISYTGLATLSAPDNFHVVGTKIVNSRPGLLMWSNAAAAIPFSGAYLCVAAPIHRFAPMNAGGTSGPPVDCTGVLDQHVTDAFMVAKGWTPGTITYFQFWYRDPGAIGMSGLTDALEVPIQP